MKVIIKGENRLFRHTCIKCKSVLEYNMHDVNPSGSLIDIIIDTITCPVCGIENEVNFEKE